MRLTLSQPQAAQKFLVLPPELASIDEPEAIVTEYLHYRQFFLIWDAIACVVEWQAQEVGLDFDAQGQGQGQGTMASARDVWDACTLCVLYTYLHHYVLKEPVIGIRFVRN